MTGKKDDGFDKTETTWVAKIKHAEFSINGSKSNDLFMDVIIL